MKNLFKLFALAICLMLSGNALYAQNDDKAPQKPRFTPEQFTEMQAKHIAEKIAMDDADTKRFVETYCQFQKELWSLNTNAKPKQKKEELTEEEAGKILKERFEHSQKILDVRTKYYEEYSKFLSQKQIMRVYELEKQMKNQFNKNAKKPGQRPGEKSGQKPGPRPGVNAHHGQHHGQAQK